MKKNKLLLIDAVINFILGILLLIFTKPLIDFLGVPYSELHFYPNILGAVLIGIAIALVIEYYRREKALVGLGLGGAVTINLCGGIVLIIWLLSGKLSIPLKGNIFLWALALILVLISSFELLVNRNKNI